jgi:uncharacterized metal-binding protein YceD (DUF177 family)
VYNQLFGNHQINFYFCRLFEVNLHNPEQYQIAFSGLKPGTHVFDFKIGKSFFEQVEDEEIRDGQVGVTVTMVKEERMMDLHFTIHGTVMVSCDRCNELMEIEVNGNERLIVKYGEGYYEETEDIQIIPETAHQFDVGPFIYEYIHLLVPIRRVHQEDSKGNSQCDPDILRKLKELSEHHAKDPRWEALNQLKKK